MTASPLPESAGPADVWQKVRLRAPREEGGIFARPGVGEAAALCSSNVARFQEHAGHVLLCTRPLERLRREARREVLALARRYTAGLHEGGGRGAGPAEAESGPLVVTGHQPVWFHPGVWAKNFATAALARRVNGTAINFIVDHDTRGSTSVWVPRGTRRQPSREAVPYDAAQPARPWEEIGSVADSGLFASFGDRLNERMRDWNISPLAAEVWPDVAARIARGERLVEAFAAARVRREAAWGAGTLELPTSLLAGTEAFAWFACHLLADLPALHAAYNATVREYRRVNGVRNDRHPVPELGVREGGWLEAPLWVWKAGSTKRGRLFARRDGRRILLADEQGSLPELKFADNGDACCASRELAGWPARGVRLRPRALTMTMFTRMFLADLFVHGIGGAKYDEITDRLIAVQYGWPAPGFLTLTSTEPLPLEAWNVTAADLDRAKRQLRELDFNPERRLSVEAPAGADWEELLTEKRRLCDEQHAADAARAAGVKPPKGTGAVRFRRLQEINGRLAGLLADDRATLLAKYDTLQAEARANRVLAHREYAWLLHPEPRLREAMGRVSALFA